MADHSLLDEFNNPDNIIVGLAEVVRGALPIRSPPCEVVQKLARLDECRGVTILSGTISNTFDWGRFHIFSVFF